MAQRIDRAASFGQNLYVDTRGAAGEPVPFTHAVINGLAQGGGLYVPEELPTLSLDEICALARLPYAQRAAAIYKAFNVDLPDEAIDELMGRAYGDNFDDEAICPITSLDESTHILELWHGPTSAFKDMALQCLPHFFSASAEKLREEGTLDHEFMILVATSGDTGKAALEGFKGVDGVSIGVLFPDGGVSDIQRKQMVTTTGDNVQVWAVRGNFDDAQTAVKQVFAKVGGENLLAGKGVRLSSANSINIGRLAPQVVYYFRAYADLVRRGTVAVGERVDYVVPTGNFGDILAGYFARELGLPVGTLVCASNANNVLTDFIRTGRYDKKRPFYLTSSPSMDILVSSNLERLLFLLSGDEQLVAKLMRQLTEDGAYEVPEELKEKIQSLFWAGCCGDDETKRTIGRVWQEHHYLCDTHTAVAWNVAQQYKAANPAHAPVVVLSTASPYKFPAAVLEGLGEKAEGDEFAVMEQLERLPGVPAPKNLRGLRERPVRHTTVLDREEMLPFVLEKAQEKKWF